MQYHSELKNDIRRLNIVSTTANNDELYLLLKAGDLTVKEQMIVGNMSLAIWLTDSYLRIWPQYEYLQSDLLSSAFVGLVDAVNGLSKRSPNGRINPTGYISRTIRRRLASTAQQDTKHSKVSHDPNQLTQASYDADGTTDIWSTLDAACESELDRQLITLRAEGYTFREISDKFRIPKQTLITWLQGIRKRFDDLMAS